MQADATVADGPSERGDLGSQVRSTVGRLHRRFRSERSDGTLGDAALAVLTRLYKYGPQTLTQLSEYDHVSPASMSQSVNRLASAGYAVRSPDPSDRRRVLFSATPEGSAIAQDARNQRNAWLDGHLQALSAEDQRVIARACQLLTSIADA